MSGAEPSFNLLDEPWIKVTGHDGNGRELGLRDIFAQAGELKRISGESPAQDFAVLRVALAVLYRAFDFGEDIKENRKQWAAAWEDKKLPLEHISRYLDKYSHRFDLLDREAPFMQTPSLATKSGEWKSLEAIIPDSPELGDLFYRRSAIEPLPLAEAGRWLVHCLAFDFSGIKSGAVGDPRVKGGKGYPIGIGWAGWLGGTVLEGHSLLETLLLNIVDHNPAAWAGAPIWELPVPTAAVSAEPLPKGQLTLLTWPQRRVRLHAEDGMVTGALVCNGDPVDYLHQEALEMMSPWRYSEPQSKKAKEDIYMPKAINPDRALWRGLSAVLPEADVDTTKGRTGSEVKVSKPAGVMEALKTRTGRRSGVVPQNYRLSLRIVGYEYGPQMASYNRLLTDDLAFPALLAADKQTIQFVLLAANRTQDTAAELRKFANNLAIAAGGERGAAGFSAEGSFYSDVDPEFRQWVSGLTSETDLNRHLALWTEQLRRLALTKAAEMIAGVPDSAWSGREVDERQYNVGHAELWFRRGLGKVLPRPEEQKPGEKVK